jgi:threonine-phosphate decarboxylase
MLETEVHGGNAYGQDGSFKTVLDFSTTAMPEAPTGWQAQARSALEGLRRYPQVHARGLEMAAEKSWSLPSGSVLAGNGVAECMGWIAAFLAQGGCSSALVESPCFWEVPRALGAHGVQVHEKEKGIKANSFWAANPQTPTGLVRDSKTWMAKWGRLGKHRSGFVMVLDESLESQALEDFPSCLALAVEQPGWIVLRSPAKGLGLPGLRLGFAVAHPDTIKSLRPFQQPWPINGLTQSMGVWILRRGKAGGTSHRRERMAAKKDLLRRLRRSPRLRTSLQTLESDTGYFLCKLKKGKASELASRLQAQGILVRACGSFGKTWQSFLRLNPRAPKDNQRLVTALETLL